MRLLITWIGPWYDKGEAAMLVSMADCFRSKVPDLNITAMPSSFRLNDIDIDRYGRYGINTEQDGLFTAVFEINTRLRLNGKKISRILVVVSSLFLTILRYSFWSFIRRFLGKDIDFLLGGNHAVNQFFKTDLVVFCGGQNIMGVSINLIAAIFEIIIARFFHKPIVLYAQSFGSFNKIYDRLIIKYILNKVNLITTREPISHEIIMSIGISTPAFVTADAAFLLSEIPSHEAYELFSRDAGFDLSSNNLNVGITVIDLKISDHSFENYLTTIAKAADYLIEHYKARVIFFPQVIVPIVKDDRLASQQVFEKISNKSNITILTNDYTPEQIKGLYGCMDLIIGTRFHSCILAQSMGVPTIAIEYEGHKALGIMSLLGLEEFVCNIDTLTSNKLIEKIDIILADKQKIKTNLSKKILVMREKCWENIELSLKYTERV